jgi:hypothetical protein
MFRSTRKALMALGALGALALGGSTLADAASNGSSGSGSSGSSTTQQGAPAGKPPANGQRPDPTKPGGHRGKNGKTEVALADDVAAKVKAAALAKVPGATFERAETDVDHGSPYEAHLRKSDGTELEVLVNKSFEVTAVNTLQHP